MSIHVAGGETGRRNPDFGIDRFGLEETGVVFYNLQAAELYEHAARNDEARISAGGALVVETGSHTGRSAQDKFVVRDALTEESVWWDNNKEMSPAKFETLYQDMLEEAIAKANATRYGLAAYAFTDSAAAAETLSERLEVGHVAINHFGGGVPESPFGGVKESGIGREGGKESLDAYLVTKYVSQRFLAR